MRNPVDALYERALPATRQGALYNAFSYPTKISAESVAVFIACHTKPGDRVLDVFGGSGTTGIAALLCERPTAAMLEMAAAAGVAPDWGPRDAVVYELSEIGSLLGRVMTDAPNPVEFARAAEEVLSSAEAAVPDLYSAADPDGGSGVVRHVIWSDRVSCPGCSAESTYADVRVRRGPLRFVDEHTCTHCGATAGVEAWNRVLVTRRDLWTGDEVTVRARAPWRVYGKTGSRNWSREATSRDLELSEKAAEAPLPASAPIAALRWGDLYRSGYHQGMTHLHHLYTGRNFLAMATLWEAIEAAPAHLRDALRLLVLSYNGSHSTLMTRVVLKKNSKEFILTGAQSGVMYVSGMPVEKNVFIGLSRKVKTFTQAFKLLHGLTGNVDVVAGSSTDLAVPCESIDYVFTDPPFGAYIPYSEINQVNELWLGHATDPTSEAIVSKAQDKSIDAYRALLTDVFSEVARVMKPDADATVVFHSAHATVWQALARSLRDAGLGVVAASSLDKTQASFKQVSGHVAVSGDPLLRVRRVVGEHTERTVPSIDQLVEEMGLDETRDRREQERLYAKVVGQALVAGASVTLDARTFYQARRRGESA